MKVPGAWGSGRAVRSSIMQWQAGQLAPMKLSSAASRSPHSVSAVTLMSAAAFVHVWQSMKRTSVQGVCVLQLVHITVALHSKVTKQHCTVVADLLTCNTCYAVSYTSFGHS